MNYIYEINAFFDWIETNSISTSAMNLWHTLMNINNKTGWKKEFTVSRTFIEAKSGLKKDAYYAARKLLQEKGRIGFREQGSQATVFWIIPFSSQFVDNQTNSAKTSPTLKSKQTENQTTEPTEIATENQIISQTIIPTKAENPTTSPTINPTNSTNILKQNNTKQMNDNEYIRVKEYYEQSFGIITPFLIEELQKWIEELSSDIVIEAIHRAVEKNKPWVYARKILINWSHQKVHNLQDLHVLDNKHSQNSPCQSKYKAFTKEELIF